MASERTQSSQALHPGDTPLVRKTSSCTVHLPANHIAVKQQMAHDMAEEIVGGMPYRNFLDAFMKLDSTRFHNVKKSLKTVENDHFDQIPAEGLEKHMYDKLVTCIEEENLLLNYDVLNTSNHADKNSHKDRKWRPDVSAFKKTGATKPVSDIMKFDKLELPIELKLQRPEKPSSDPTGNEETTDYLSQPEAGAENRGQLMTVLTEMCARQFRTHAFSVYLDSEEVRFIRTDRCGLIVTEAINYRSDSKALAEFFLRFNELTDAERGWDPTVRLAPPGIASVVKEKLEQHCIRTETFQQGCQRPVVAITVPGGRGGQEREVYGWHSFSDPESLTGRGTRGLPVYDQTDDKVYFLKDMWRYEQLEPEYDILDYLNRKNVPHIPKVVAGGDLPGDFHRTRTQDYFGEPWQLGKVSSNDYDGLDCRVQHRLLEDLINARIWDCSDARNMMTLVYHAFIAHEAAYNVGYLHRDISDNNVMVVLEGGKPVEGILSDWDLALRVKDENGNWIKEHNRRQRCRTGTWYFLSARLLNTPTRSHLLLDDLESIFYLVLFLSLCLFETDTQRCIIFKQVFARSEYDERQQVYVGGSGKIALISNGWYISKPDLRFIGNDALMSWITTTRLALRRYYYLEPFEADLASLPEEVSPNHPHYGDKKAWDNLQVRNHQAMKDAFEKALNEDGWSTTKPGKSPFESAPCFQKTDT